MKIASLSLLFLNIICGPTFSCELNQNFDYVSLSGPISMITEKLGIQNDLMAISTHHPVSDFNGKRLAGGIFLSKKNFKSNKKIVVFYDESRELEKHLKRITGIKLHKVFTAKLDPFLLSRKSLQTLKPFLLNCSTEVKKVLKYIDEAYGRIQSLKKLNQVFLFYLGNIHKSRENKLLMVNDGPVKVLNDLSLIKTYPSNASYINWSQKTVLNLERKNTVIHIGLDANTQQNQFQKISSNTYNFFSKRLFIPGISQISQLEILMDSLSKAFPSGN